MSGPPCLRSQTCGRYCAERSYRRFSFLASFYRFWWRLSAQLSRPISTPGNLTWRLKRRSLKGGLPLSQRRGATESELRESRKDIVIGMLFSNIIMYFIILSTGATLHKAGQEIETAAQAAEALRPLAGDAAGILFALGIIAVG